MSQARTDLFEALSGLEQAAVRLTPPSSGRAAARSPDHLLLNGLHVVAFAALEDFLRRRTIEVISALARAPITFKAIPESLQIQIIQEWLKGMNAYLNRKDSNPRAPTLLLEAEIIGTTAVTAPFTVSDYCFGRSQSNLTAAQISSLLSAIEVAGGMAALAEISSRVGFSHLGQPEQIFMRLSESRHAAAHGFGLDFRLTDFFEDVRAGIRVVAFTFDTCLSQGVYSIRRGIEKNQMLGPYSGANVSLRAIRFDSIRQEWSVKLNELDQSPITRGQYNKKLATHGANAYKTGETVYVIDATGVLKDWLQPM